MCFFNKKSFEDEKKKFDDDKNLIYILIDF